MISYATMEMIPELSQLWYLCFHDEEPYRSFYYENMFSPEDTLCYCVDDHIAAMLTLLRAERVQDNKNKPVRYVYAVATHPKHRRKGYAAALLKYANEHYETLLVPASTELFSYYEKAGYQTMFYLKTAVIQREDILYPKAQSNHVSVFSLNTGKENQDLIQIRELTAVNYYAIRKQFFTQKGNVLWSIEALDYILKENHFTGGYAVEISVNGLAGAVLYYQNKGQLFIKEIAAYDMYIPIIVQYLLHQTQTDTATVRLSPESSVEGKIIPYGMACNMQKNFPQNRYCYFNLALD